MRKDDKLISAPFNGVPVFYPCLLLLALYFFTFTETLFVAEGQMEALISVNDVKLQYAAKNQKRGHMKFTLLFYSLSKNYPRKELDEIIELARINRFEVDIKILVLNEAITSKMIIEEVQRLKKSLRCDYPLLYPFGFVLYTNSNRNIWSGYSFNRLKFVLANLSEEYPVNADLIVGTMTSWVFGCTKIEYVFKCLKDCYPNKSDEEIVKIFMICSYFKMMKRHGELPAYLAYIGKNDNDIDLKNIFAESDDCQALDVVSTEERDLYYNCKSCEFSRDVIADAVLMLTMRAAHEFQECYTVIISRIKECNPQFDIYLYSKEEYLSFAPISWPYKSCE